MATRARINLPSGNTGTALVRWESLAEGDVGDVIAFSLHRRASVQVEGTFGAGGSLVLEGSNDSGDNWQPLSDVQGTVLTFTAVRLKQVTDVSALVRPRVTGGDGSTSLTVSVCMCEAA
jgi:hypothetical protein